MSRFEKNERIFSEQRNYSSINSSDLNSIENLCTTQNKIIEAGNNVCNVDVNKKLKQIQVISFICTRASLSSHYLSNL